MLIFDWEILYADKDVYLESAKLRYPDMSAGTLLNARNEALLIAQEYPSCANFSLTKDPHIGIGLSGKGLYFLLSFDTANVKAWSVIFSKEDL